MKKISLRFVIVFAILLTSTLACSLPGKTADQPATVAPMSPDEAGLLEEQLKATIESGAASGQVSITITQQQLNAYLSTRLAEMDQEEPRISDPVVVLTGGNMEIYGKVTQSGITLDTKSVLKPGVASDGSPILDVISVDLGGVPVPESLTNRLDTMINGALQDYLSQNGSRFVISSLTIEEGQMTVVGSPQ